MMQMLLKSNQDASLSKAYSDCFILLTQHFYEQNQKQIREFLSFTYKELLTKFLSGRCNQSAGLNLNLFKSVIEKCPCLGWSLIKVILRCFLNKTQEKDKSEMKEEKKAKKPEEEGGSRSNHQRLQAIELCLWLIKSSAKDKEAM